MEEILRKIAYCFIPLLMEQMLLCAASALFADAPVVGVIAGHVLTAGMCVYLVRRDEGMLWLRSSGMMQGEAEVRWPDPLQGRAEARGSSMQGEAGARWRDPLQGRAEARGSGHTRGEADVLGQDGPRKDPDRRRQVLRFTGSSISVVETLVWAAAACASCLLCTYVLNITGLAEADEAYAEADAVIEEAPGILRFILVIIAAPVSEELLYRGVLYHRAAGCFGGKTGFLASVAAFALSHGNIVQGLAACVSGTLLTAACCRCSLSRPGSGHNHPIGQETELPPIGQEAELHPTGKEAEMNAEKCCMSEIGRLWLPILLHSVINACSLYVVPML